MTTIGDNSQLKSYVDRINRLEDEKKTISSDVRDLYTEAGSNGLNPKALRVVVRNQRADKKKREQLEADVDAYMVALGLA